MTENQLSPAERFAQAKANKRNPSIESFASLLKFPMDPFQEQSCRALAAGKGVLVAAPTGAGKTIVVIDPLLDGVTGMQTRATRGFDQRVAAFVAERYTHIEVRPMTVENLAAAKFVFIGTFNTINNAGQPTGPPSITSRMRAASGAVCGSAAAAARNAPRGVSAATG